MYCMCGSHLDQIHTYSIHRFNLRIQKKKLTYFWIYETLKKNYCIHVLLQRCKIWHVWVEKNHDKKNKICKTGIQINGRKWSSWKQFSVCVIASVYVSLCIDLWISAPVCLHPQIYQTTHFPRRRENERSGPAFGAGNRDPSSTGLKVWAYHKVLSYSSLWVILRTIKPIHGAFLIIVYQNTIQPNYKIGTKLSQALCIIRSNEK
jgi:hypothetical protein